MFKDLLVTVDTSPASTQRVSLAVQLARRCGAHLVGLFINPPAPVAPYIGAEGSAVGLAEMIKSYEEGSHAEAVAAGKHFADSCDREGVTYEWREVSGVPDEVAVVHARYSDLAILGQIDPDSNAIADLAPEAVALQSGRPILVVPYVGKFDTVGERVLVAWNASREATRAVNDAMPILTTAKSVTVLAANPKKGKAGHGDMPGADIALHLARHGVKAEAAATKATDIDIGNLLLSTAADIDADLIVMGAYGHSRMRELLMGGATRSILQTMTVPVLLSH